MKVYFKTPTRISLINLITIGDSEKRDDPTKIGQFSSGMAFATALLLRDGVKMSIDVYSQETIEIYTYMTRKLICASTEKTKTIIVLIKEVVNLIGEPISKEYIETAFALQLGYNWELWMAYRELMSNVLDEGGTVDTDYEHIDVGTRITLEFDETNHFYEVWRNRHLYMNFKDPLFKVSETIEALENQEGYLRIYKQNILVYEDRERPSRYAWNIKFGEIDERRILNNVYSVECTIAGAILTTTNRDFLKTIITSDFAIDQKEFLRNPWVSYYGSTDVIHKIASSVYEKFGEVKSYEWLIDTIKKRKDCKIGGKKITTVEDSLYSYSKTVTIETVPVSIAEPSIVVEDVKLITEFESNIQKHFNFDLGVEVRVAKLKGSKAVADKFEKCIIIDESFDIEKDFHIFLIEYIDLTTKGNVIENMAKYICNLIKK